MSELRVSTEEVGVLAIGLAGFYCESRICVFPRVFFATILFQPGISGPNCQASRFESMS
jgi:hypothetical protein